MTLDTDAARRRLRDAAGAALCALACAPAAAPPPLAAPVPAPIVSGEIDWHRGPPEDDLAFALLQVATRRYWADDDEAAQDALGRARLRAPRSASIALFALELRAAGPEPSPHPLLDAYLLESILDGWPWHPIARQVAGVPIPRPDAALPFDPFPPRQDLAPEDPQRAVELARARKTDAAEAWFEAHPADDARWWLARARSARWRGDFEAARRACDAALERSPHDPLIRIERVRTELADGRSRDAIDHAEAALADHPDDPRVLGVVGESATATQEWRLAEAALRIALDAAPEELGLYHAFARLWAARRAGEGELAGVTRRSGEHWSDALVQGGLHELRGELGEAQRHYEAAAASAPDEAVVANHLAWLLTERGTEPARAVRLARQAVAQRPDDPMILDTLGWALLHAGQPKAAIAPLTRAIERLPPDAPERSLVLHHLARAHDRAGDWGTAIGFANRALRALAQHPHVAWGPLIQRHARELSDG